MNRITRGTMRRLPPRTTVISGAVLGLAAGAAVYGAVSSSAEAPAHPAFKAKAPAAAAPKASAANCAASAKLEKGVCVVHVVRIVVAPPSAASIAAHAKPALVAGTTPGSILKAAASKGATAKNSAGVGAGKPASAVSEASDGEDGSTNTATAVTSPAPAPAALPTATKTPKPAPSAPS
jgi:hypothetical protein